MDISWKIRMNLAVRMVKQLHVYGRKVKVLVMSIT